MLLTSHNLLYYEYRQIFYDTFNLSERELSRIKKWNEQRISKHSIMLRFFLAKVHKVLEGLTTEDTRDTTEHKELQMVLSIHADNRREDDGGLWYSLSLVSWMFQEWGRREK